MVLTGLAKWGRGAVAVPCDVRNVLERSWRLSGFASVMAGWCGLGLLVVATARLWSVECGCARFGAVVLAYAAARGGGAVSEGCAGSIEVAMSTVFAAEAWCRNRMINTAE